MKQTSLKITLASAFAAAMMTLGAGCGAQLPGGRLRGSDGPRRALRQLHRRRKE